MLVPHDISNCVAATPGVRGEISISFFFFVLMWFEGRTG